MGPEFNPEVKSCTLFWLSPTTLLLIFYLQFAAAIRGWNLALPHILCLSECLLPSREE